MQPDYNKLWGSNIHEGQAPDAQFYEFFEDSLNQFISTNCGGSQPAANNSPEQTTNDSGNNGPARINTK